MIVDHELEMRINSTVDETDPVRCICGERYIITIAAIFVGIRSIDQSIVECRWPAALSREIKLVYCLPDCQYTL